MAKYFAYCPVLIEDEDLAFRVAYPQLMDEKVVLIYKDFGTALQYKLKDYIGDRANSYGYDLYFYRVNEDGTRTLISRGDFL